VAKALGASQSIGRDGSQNQTVTLAQEGFSQIGAGSGGYAVYVCHRRVWTAHTDMEGEATPILLHVTPYGPSILDVMPRYIVLEFEDSIDRRGKVVGIRVPKSLRRPARSGRLLLPRRLF
jgi:hypothetical protein